MKIKTFEDIFKRAFPMALILASFWVCACFAEGSPEKKNDKCENPWRSRKDDVLQELNLTKEQQAQLGDYRKKTDAEKKAGFGMLRDYRVKLREELDKPKSDLKKIEYLTSEIKKLQAHLLDNQVESILKVKQVLTPEQFEKFREKAKERWEMRKEHTKMFMNNKVEK